MRDRHQPLHPETRMALADLRRAGGKAILLLNRRGWSNFLSCRACGRVWLCPNCDVALVLHRHGHFIACHHCGHRERMPESLRRLRIGVGRAPRRRHRAHRARAARGARRGRLSRSSASTPTPPSLPERARTLQRFQAAPAGVLVGTQMVAKGHDFPDVSLGVVLDADQTLRFPDFRAEERTFALITQLAGRTGRGALGEPRPGPDAGSRRATRSASPPATTPTASSPTSSSAARRSSYPPYASLIRVVCSAEDDGAGARGRPPRSTASWPRLDAAVLGPAPLFRLRGRARSQLVIKAARAPGGDRRRGAAPSTASPRAPPGAARRSASTSIRSNRARRAGARDPARN